MRFINFFLVNPNASFRYVGLEINRAKPKGDLNETYTYCLIDSNTFTFQLHF